MPAVYDLDVSAVDDLGAHVIIPGRCFSQGYKDINMGYGRGRSKDTFGFATDLATYLSVESDFELFNPLTCIYN